MSHFWLVVIMLWLMFSINSENQLTNWRWTPHYPRTSPFIFNQLLDASTLKKTEIYYYIRYLHKPSLLAITADVQE